MAESKDGWKTIGEAREYYMAITHKDFKKMDNTDRASWFSITEEIENQIKEAKLTFDSVVNAEGKGQQDEQPSS